MPSFFLMIRRPPRSPLFPYTPLFRSPDDTDSSVASGSTVLVDESMTLKAVAYASGPQSGGGVDANGRWSILNDQAHDRTDLQVSSPSHRCTAGFRGWPSRCGYGAVGPSYSGSEQGTGGSWLPCC